MERKGDAKHGKASAWENSTNHVAMLDIVGIVDDAGWKSDDGLM